MSFFNNQSYPIIDLRSEAAYLSSHIVHASHFPLESIIDRMHALPRKTQPLKLVGTKQQVKIAKASLESKGYQIDSGLEWNEQIVKDLLKSGLIEKGMISRRLWEPAPIVEYFVKHYEIENRNADKIKNVNALDIGCGAGRDSVFLAMNGWQVHAVDYLPGAMEKLSQLAMAHGVKVKGYQLDLEQQDNQIDQVGAVFDLIVVVRYLHRPLLVQLNQKVRLGGYVVYQTFYKGCEKFGKPRNPRFILQPGELATAFNGFEIIKDEIEYLADGRPTNVFIARKVAR